MKSQRGTSTSRPGRPAWARRRGSQHRDRGASASRDAASRDAASLRYVEMDYEAYVNYDGANFEADVPVPAGCEPFEYTCSA